LIFPRHHSRHCRLSLAGNGDRPRQGIGQRWIRVAKVEVLLIANQLISKLVVPSLHGRPRGAIGQDSAGTHDQQRVRLPRLGPERPFVVFANRPQRHVERIPGPERPGEILGSQQNALRLHNYAKLRALDVNWPPPRARRAFVWDERIRLFAIGLLFLALFQFLFAPRDVLL
jgi:hypothetical protein